MTNYLDINLDDVHVEERPGGTRTQAPVGYHEMRISNFEVGLSSGGHNQVVFSFENDQYYAKWWIIYNNNGSKEKAAENTRIGREDLKKACLACGWTQRNPPSTNWWLGKPCKISVKHKEGSDRPKVVAMFKSDLAQDVSAGTFNGAAPMGNFNDQIPDFTKQ